MSGKPLEELMLQAVLETTEKLSRETKIATDAILTLSTAIKKLECEECHDTERLPVRICKCGKDERDHGDVDAQDPEACSEFDWDGVEREDEACWWCAEQSYVTCGLTYVAVSSGGQGVVVLDSDCTALLHDLNEVGGDPDDVGLDAPPDEGIWKGVVKLHSSRSWEGEVDVEFNVVGDWEEVESYPEPECVKRTQGGCDGMRRERDEAGTWACDAHAGEVA